MRRRRRKSKAKRLTALERLRKQTARQRIHERTLLYKHNDRILTTEYRQKLRHFNIQQIQRNILFTLKPALLITMLKTNIIRMTKEAINIEVQNTLHLIDNVRQNIIKIFAVEQIETEGEVSRVETDSEMAKKWLAKIYLLFKSFDSLTTGETKRFMPAIEEQPQPKRDELKITDINAEEQRYTTQKTSLLMEIEDNEIRMIAKEQILRERIEEQEVAIGKLNRQITDLKRRMGLIPSVSTRRASRRRLSMLSVATRSSISVLPKKQLRISGGK